jgi:hypothetical protein
MIKQPPGRVARKRNRAVGIAGILDLDQGAREVIASKRQHVMSTAARPNEPNRNVATVFQNILQIFDLGLDRGLNCKGLVGSLVGSIVCDPAD